MVQSKEIDALLEKHQNKLIYKASTLMKEINNYLQLISGGYKELCAEEYYYALNHLKAILDRVYGPQWLDNWIKSDVE